MQNFTDNHVTSLISAFNSYAHMTIQYGSSKNIEAAKRALEVAEDFNEVRSYLVDAITKKTPGWNDFPTLMSNFCAVQPFLRDVAKSREVRPITQEEKAINQAMSVLAKTMSQVLADQPMGEIEEQIKNRITASVDKYIYDTYGPIQRATTLKIDTKTVKVKGVTHAIFMDALSYVAAREPVYIWGPAGSGKNVLCKQIAEALDLEFYFTNAVTQEYQLKGFTDANGKYQESQFYKAFTGGGLFMLDELDASIPEVLIILNAAIANGYFDFPAPIGRVTAHKDFRVIAAGNTAGYGADYEYVGRAQLDAASTNRFGYLEVNYDPRVEEACAKGDKDLLEFCRAFRRATKEAGIKTVVSYRDITRLAKMTPLIGAAKAVKSGMLKALDKADLQVVKDKVQGHGQFSAAFNEILQSM